MYFWNWLQQHPKWKVSIFECHNKKFDLQLCSRARRFMLNAHLESLTCGFRGFRDIYKLRQYDKACAWLWKRITGTEEFIPPLLTFGNLDMSWSRRSQIKIPTKVVSLSFHKQLIRGIFLLYVMHWIWAQRLLP